MKQSPKMPAEKRRAQLLKAAEKVISKKGYAKASVESIAREAGLTKGALYFHFKSKEDIFFELIKHRNEQSRDVLLDLLNDDLSANEVVADLIKTAFRLIEGKKYFNLDLWQKAHKVPRIKKYLEEEHRLMRSSIVQFVKKRSDLSQRECEWLYDLIHTFIEGLVVQIQGLRYRPNLDTMEKNLLELKDMYLRRA